jgi:pseudouridine synthase
MAKPERIQKILANWGIASRRTIERLIAEGKVSVNGEVLTGQGMTIDPDGNPVIKISGKQVKKPKNTKLQIFAFNKPMNVVSTLKDDQGRKSIKDFLPPHQRLYPVGRLDMNSTGLLLITNNGELTNRLLHPSFKVAKEYVVKIVGASLTREEKFQFSTGIELEDGKTAPCKLVQHKDPQTFTVVLKEGRKRQIRRMFDKLDRKVIQLNRVTFGPIKLGNLKAGQMRRLTTAEQKALLKAAGLPVT